MNIHNQTIDLGNGREITIETGKLAKQAHGSVVVRSGDTILLATIVSSYEPMDVDFLPLTVDYREKYAAAGRFPRRFFKRKHVPLTPKCWSCAWSTGPCAPCSLVTTTPELRS